MPPERLRLGPCPQEGLQQRDTPTQPTFRSRQDALRSIQELNEYSERAPNSFSSTKDSSSPPSYQDGRSYEADIIAQAQQVTIARLLAQNLDLYNGHKHFGSIRTSLSECDPTLVPNPLFFDPEDRQVVLPRRSASNLQPGKAYGKLVTIQETGSATLSSNGTPSQSGNHERGASDLIPATPADKQRHGLRRSWSSPSKPHWYSLPKHERESPDLPRASELDTDSSTTWLLGSSKGLKDLAAKLSPARKLPKSPRARLFASSPSTSTHCSSVSSRNGPGMHDEYNAINRPVLPRTSVWTSRDEGFPAAKFAPTDPFTAVSQTTSGLILRGGHGVTPSAAFPRDMMKVMLVDMAKEGWFEAGDIWIYFRLVKTSKEDVYLNKELKVCKIHPDGVLTVAIPKGPLKKIPEAQCNIDRKPVPPPHGRYGAPFPDSPTLPSDSSNLSILRHTIRSRRQEINTLQTDSDTLVDQPTTPSSTITLNEALSMISGHDSMLTPKNRISGPELGRSASVRSTPTYGPRPQPPKRRLSGSMFSNDVAVTEIKLLQDLERRIFELDGRVNGSRRYEFGSNIWKQIRCLRGNRDLGTLWDMRQECARGWKKSAGR